MAVCEDRVSVNFIIGLALVLRFFRYETGCDMSATVCMGKHVYTVETGCRHIQLEVSEGSFR